MADSLATRQAAESWFVDHGLPYFVDHLRDRVRARLARRRVILVLGTAAVLGAVGGVLIGLLSDPSAGATSALGTALVVVGLYALRALDAWLITRWALRRAFASLGLLFPLATRALPMLLLFVTFLFINTEVWQVASHLVGGVLWGTVLLFGLAAVGFLLVRLTEELDEYDDEIDADELVQLCQGTPLAHAAVTIAADAPDLSGQSEVRGLEKANLVLVLLITQAVQVLLLALAVFGFFLVFGSVAIDDAVIEAWIGRPPSYPFGPHLVSVELAKVSVFLAAFSGLYFTVYAVTDATYRKQFFTAIMRELAQVVSARVAYRHLRD
ncbi:hypothetical protein [Nocardioides sp.]|uniref:hypothetical protein n=1 Tax=Nocardioides sp. TaxID=35761 RepID=UPI003D0F955F